MKSPARWLLAATLLVASPATAQDDPTPETATASVDDDVRRRVDVLLSGIERVPTPADWAAIGDEAVPALIEVLGDPKSKIITRGRAAIALGHFDTDESKTALRDVVTSDGTPSLLLRKGIVALTKVEGPAALTAVAPHLEHRSKRVREVAINAVGKIGTQQAHDALGARARAESSDYLRKLIEAELQKPVRPAKVEAPPTTVAPDQVKPTVEAEQ